jgi:Icc-related predicted phosphoesterase
MRLFGKKGPDGGGDGAEARYSLYYSSDIHGSDRCWRKFLGAGRHYKVNALIMGGDLTGKAIVPIRLGEDGSYEADFLGELRKAENEAELQQIIDAVRFNGMYAWIASGADVSRVGASADAQSALFDEILREDVGRWIDLADERLPGTGIEAFVMAGNDDPWPIDEALERGTHIHQCDDRVVRAGAYEMISLSYANPTPWDSPRELDEDGLYDRFKRLAEQLESPATSIFNLHVPPHDSGLDTAIEINPADLTRVERAGSPVEKPVGSTAVRQIIEEYQPLLALHGHIHECRGAAKIGRTLAINPGSEYNSGRIHGVIVRLRGPEVIGHQFVVG